MVGRSSSPSTPVSPQLFSTAYRLVLLVPTVILMLTAWPAWADVRVVNATGEHRMGDRDTREDAIRLATEAAKRGLDIYGEKPLAKTITEQQAIVHAVEKHDLIWQTGSWQRSQPTFHSVTCLVWML